MNNMEAEDYRRKMNRIIECEVSTINHTFAGMRPGRPAPAVTSISQTSVAGRFFIAYELTLDRTVLPQDIEKYLPKLQDALYRLRNRAAKEERPVTVRLRYAPLALEVNHPAPEPLDSSKANTVLPPDTMLAGRKYGGAAPTDDVVSLANMAHVLAVGMTGSGKSTLLRMMIGSLALNTDPAKLRMFIVDPKAEDFLEFKRLPHCEMFAGRREITQAIARVRAILAERQDIEGRFEGQRIVLFLDELSQVQDPVAIRQLNDLMAVGRSKKINVILATQYPTKDVIGKVDLTNVGVRFVGQVATATQAHIAAGQGETGAHKLFGKGAFLRVEGDVTRLQAYWLDDAGTAQMVDAAVKRWGRRAVSSGYRGGEQSVRTGATTGEQPVRNVAYTGEALVTPPILAQEWRVWGENTPAVASPVSVARMPVAVAARPAPELLPNAVYPLGKTRELTPAEVATVRRWRAEGVSGNVICERIFGPKNTQRLEIIRRALEGGAA